MAHTHNRIIVWSGRIIVWGTKVSALLLAILLLAGGTAYAQHRARFSKDLEQVAASGAGATRVIVDAAGADAEALAARHGGRVIRSLTRGALIELDAASLDALAADEAVEHASRDARVERMMATTVVSTGADQVQAGALGARYTGEGITVAVIDSGIGNHPDLNGRVIKSVDFLGTEGRAIDRAGHGTHVAGSVAAMAPGAKLVNLRVLDENGHGYTSDAIDAIDWTIAHKDEFSIRVVNLSLGHPAYESYLDDPLCQAVDRAVSAGLVVVAAAGNMGKLEDGTRVIGAITSPGTSPWALTVGAISTNGTAKRSDDFVTDWSSRGPTIDGILKPELVAPGSRIVSTAAAGSTLWSEHPDWRVAGPGVGYLRLSGTSMATAVTSGAVATLLEANPALTPLDVRIALQISASFLPEAGLIGGGAGSLNEVAALKALEDRGLSRVSTNVAEETVAASGSAFALQTSTGTTIVWGTAPLAGTTIVWGTTPLAGTTIVWGTTPLAGTTIVWGTTPLAGTTIVWGTTPLAGTTIVWGTTPPAGNTIVWGTTPLAGTTIN